MQTLQLLLEGRVARLQGEPGPQSPPVWASANPDLKFTSLNLRDGLLLTSMEVEEAVIVGLLAVGMSVLVALTIMIIW